MRIIIKAYKSTYTSRCIQAHLRRRPKVNVCGLHKLVTCGIEQLLPPESKKKKEGGGKRKREKMIYICMGVYNSKCVYGYVCMYMCVYVCVPEWVEEMARWRSSGAH